MTQRASKLISQSAGQAGVLPGAMIAFEDATLVESCRRGDLKAFEALVAKYQDRVYNLVLRMVGRHADAEELAQETFLKALEKIGQFRGASGFYTWLFRIAANLAISQRRKVQRIHFRPLEADMDGNGAAGDAMTAGTAQMRQPSPDSAAMAEETRRRVLEALDELDDEYRLVVVLRDVEDMDYEQISQVLEVPVGTVKSRLHRARCMLKDKLSDTIEA